MGAPHAARLCDDDKPMLPRRRAAARVERQAANVARSGSWVSLPPHHFLTCFGRGLVFLPRRGNYEHDRTRARHLLWLGAGHTLRVHCWRSVCARPRASADARRRARAALSLAYLGGVTALTLSYDTVYARQAQLYYTCGPPRRGTGRGLSAAHRRRPRGCLLKAHTRARGRRSRRGAVGGERRRRGTVQPRGTALHDRLSPRRLRLVAWSLACSSRSRPR